MTQVNKRKKIQYLEVKDLHKAMHSNEFILCIYKSKYKGKYKEHKETFDNNLSINEIKEIYNNFNKTLKPFESKRIPIKFFKVRKVLELEKIDED